MRRGVVTGIRAITPIANTAQGFWQSLLGGKSGAANITRFDTIRFKTKFACEVKGFEPESFLSKAAVRKYDLFTLYALAAVQEAINHASLNLKGWIRITLG